MSATDLSEDTLRSYHAIASVIRQCGSKNKRFPKDTDIEFSVLRQQLETQVVGLSGILKNMKAKKMVDYGDNFIKDNTVITLVEDYYQAAVPAHIKYDDILTKVKGDEGGHMRSGETGYKPAAVPVKVVAPERPAAPGKQPAPAPAPEPKAKPQKIDPKAEVAAAKSTGYVVPEESLSEHASQRRRDPKTEVAALKANAPQQSDNADAPVGTNYRRPNPQEEVSKARASSPASKPAANAPSTAYRRPNAADEIAKAKSQQSQAAEETPVGTNYKPVNPMEEVAMARAKAEAENAEVPAFVGATVEDVNIRGGAVSAAKGKFAAAAAAAAAAEPAPPPPVRRAAAAPVHVEPQHQEPAPEPEHHEAVEAQEQHTEQPVAEPAAEQAAQHEEQHQPPQEQQVAVGGQLATAVYDYAGEQDGDLAFSTGDQIQVIDTSDPAGWWHGTVHGKTGVFPSNFVQIIQ